MTLSITTLNTGMFSVTVLNIIYTERHFMLGVANEPIMLNVIMLAHFLLIIKIKKRTSLFAGMGMTEGKKFNEIATFV